MTTNLIRADDDTKRDDTKRDDADLGQKLDKLLTGLDSMGRRMDAMEKRYDDDDKRRKDDDDKRKRDDDAKRDDAAACADARKHFSLRKDDDDDDGFRKRHDAEEETAKQERIAKGDPEPVAADRAKRARKDAEEGDVKHVLALDKRRKDDDDKRRRDDDDKRRRDDAARQDYGGDGAGAAASALATHRWSHRNDDAGIDPRVQAELDKLRALMPASITDEDRAKFAVEQSRADAVLAMDGKRAPGPLLGETLNAYRHRLTSLVKAYAPKWKETDTLKIADEVAFGNVQGLIYADAQEALRVPTVLEAGRLHMRERRSDTGHTIREFHGDPSGFVGMFSGNGQIARNINPRGGHQ